MIPEKMLLLQVSDAFSYISFDGRTGQPKKAPQKKGSFVGLVLSRYCSFDQKEYKTIRLINRLIGTQVSSLPTCSEIQLYFKDENEVLNLNLVQLYLLAVFYRKA